MITGITEITGIVGTIGVEAAGGTAGDNRSPIKKNEYSNLKR